MVTPRPIDATEDMYYIEFPPSGLPVQGNFPNRVSLKMIYN